MDKITVDIRENKYMPKPHGIRLELYIQLPKGADINHFESREVIAKKIEESYNGSDPEQELQTLKDSLRQICEGNVAIGVDIIKEMIK